MNCPGIERLIDFGLEESDDLEVKAHVRSCPDCQADLQAIEVLAGVGGAEREMSQELISRIIEGLPKPNARKGIDWTRGIQLFVTGGLGFLTALVSMAVSGALGTAGPREALLLASGLGALSVLWGFHQERNSTPSNEHFLKPESA